VNIALPLYRGATATLGPLVGLYLARRVARGKEDRDRLPERFGKPGLPRPIGPLVWLHAASIGEATSVLALIGRLLQDRPELEILITTGTVASARLLESRLPPRVRHQFVPVDLPRAVDRFLAHWRPDLAIWVESELWPNLVLATRRRNIPMVLVNARLSARSHARWRAWHGLARTMLASFALCLAQDDEQVRRFRELGAVTAHSVGDLKTAAPELPADPAALSELRRQVGERPRWLAASTHAGEEEAAAAAHRLIAASHPGLLTIIAPRHPVRGETIAAMLETRGLSVARRGRGDPIAAGTDVYLVDTLGELGLFYRLAGIALIGGSLVDRGGHNPFEAARLDCAILHGRYMGNCVAMAAALAVAGAAEIVADPAGLAAAVSRLLTDPDTRAARADAASRAAAASLGTLDLVLERLAPFLDRLPPSPRDDLLVRQGHPGPPGSSPRRADARS